MAPGSQTFYQLRAPTLSVSQASQKEKNNIIHFDIIYNNVLVEQKPELLLVSPLKFFLIVSRSLIRDHQSRIASIVPHIQNPTYADLIICKSRVQQGLENVSLQFVQSDVEPSFILLGKNNGGRFLKFKNTTTELVR